jgi:hypothetical protein
LGEPDCPVPLGDVRWYKVRPPINLDVWPAEFDSHPRCFSSLATWSHSTKNIEWNGEFYEWSKQRNFRAFLDMPKRTRQCFDLALITPNAEIDKLVRDNGWNLLNPVPLSDTLEHYAEFLYRSRAEFSVAKDIYVRPRSGWFSDRSVCYLAAGRPVVTQETGFTKFVPTGKGLFGFLTHDEALAAIEAINADYRMHQRAARAIAEEHFEATKTIGKLLREIGI